jgi:hypothetical protein
LTPRRRTASRAEIKAAGDGGIVATGPDETALSPFGARTFPDLPAVSFRDFTHKSPNILIN